MSANEMILQPLRHVVQTVMKHKAPEKQHLVLGKEVSLSLKFMTVPQTALVSF
jgi:hypothetical protein